MLTDLALRTAKPRESKYMMSDGGGLQIHIMPNGSKLWRLAYRFNGTPKTLSIGAYPAVTLSAAREARLAAKKLLTEGGDPSANKQLQKQSNIAMSANTFAAVAEEYAQKLSREGKAPVTLSKVTWLLEDLINPFIGARPIADIRPLEVLNLLVRVEQRGHFETASRARRICSQVFRYGVATGRNERDVCADLRGALTSPKPKPRAAITDSKGIGQLLRAIDGYSGQGVTLFALRFAPMVFVRPTELRHAVWPELNLEEALWRIPAEKMKMRRDHLVPLSSQAVALLQRLKPLTGHLAYVFPSAWGSSRPISENTLNGALRRLGYSSDEMCAHGFRRMASTQLHEAGYNSDWVELQLAHSDRNSIRATYNAAEYLDPRRAMMQWWSDHLDRLKEEFTTKS